MHYCCLLITKEFPTDEVIEKKLEPYYIGDYYLLIESGQAEVTKWPILWDFWKLGERYSGLLKLDTKKTEEKYKWHCFKNERRSGRVFRSKLLEKFMTEVKDPFIFEEEYYSSMGLRDGFIYVDGGLICDMKQPIEIEGFYLIDIDGTVYSRENDAGTYGSEVKRILDERQDCYITVLDLHS